MHMTRKFSHQSFLVPVMAATLLGCAPLHQITSPVVANANYDAPTMLGPDACRTALATQPASDSGPALDPRRIDLFVWNIHKGADPESLSDLERLAGDMDIVLIQEARLEQEPIEALERAIFWSFAPGYQTASASTGVMTLSNVMPITHCNLLDREPWLRSPKAINITQFALSSTDETLAVVNIHAVNFTFGVHDFEQQIAKIETALAEHKGPVILAGDFNTWRRHRLEVLLALADRLELNELSFAVDNRVTPLGNIVDRVFVRGLVAIDATTEIVDSSDHNPMSVRLSM